MLIELELVKIAGRTGGAAGLALAFLLFIARIVMPGLITGLPAAMRFAIVVLIIVSIAGIGALGFVEYKQRGVDPERVANLGPQLSREVTGILHVLPGSTTFDAVGDPDATRRWSATIDPIADPIDFVFTLRQDKIWDFKIDTSREFYKALKRVRSAIKTAAEISEGIEAGHKASYDCNQKGYAYNPDIPVVGIPTKKHVDAYCTAYNDFLKVLKRLETLGAEAIEELDGLTQG